MTKPVQPDRNPLVPPQPAQPSAVRSFWNDLLTEGKKKAIAAILAALSGVLLYFAKQVRQSFALEVMYLQNISTAKAMAASKALLGDNVASATPFRNLGDKNQYVLAVVAKAGAGDEGFVFLLTGDGSVFRPHKLAQDACAGMTKGIELTDAAGVLDLRGDGVHEVFSTCASGGSGAYGADVLLLDMKDGKTYASSVAAGYTETDVHPIFESEAPTDKVLVAWFGEMHKRIDLSSTYTQGALEQEQVVWNQANPHPLTGKLNLQSHPSKPPDEDFENGPPTFQDYVLDVMFKGPILAYNVKKDCHFVLYVPEVTDFYRVYTAKDRYLFLLTSEPETNQSNLKGVVWDPQAGEMSSVGAFLYWHREDIVVTDGSGKSFTLHRRASLPPVEKDDNDGKT